MYYLPHIKDKNGNLLNLRNIVAWQEKENEDINILLNVAKDEEDSRAFQESTSYFENGEIIKNEIIEYTLKNINTIKYK